MSVDAHHPTACEPVPSDRQVHADALKPARVVQKANSGIHSRDALDNFTASVDRSAVGHNHQRVAPIWIVQQVVDQALDVLSFVQTGNNGDRPVIAGWRHLI